MKSLTKVALVGSVVLGAALFSIGCGGSSSCCDGNAIKAKVNLLGENNLVKGVLPANDHTLTVNGLASTSDGTITQAVWKAYEDCSKSKVIDTKTVNTKGDKVELNLGAPGQHKVCVTVTDTNGLNDEDCTCITVAQPAGPTPVISPTALKAGCPLDGSQSVANSGKIKSYNWTLNSKDGTSISKEATASVPNPTSASKVCLTVTNSDDVSNTTCQTITAHAAPHAEIHVYKRNTQTVEVADGGALDFGSQLTLNCNGSHDDCPLTEGGRSIPANNNGTCDFDGASYESTAADCSVEPQAGVMLTGYKDSASNPNTATETDTAPYWYKENCKLTGELVQANDTAGTVTVNMCGTQVFNCVKFTVNVTDQFGGTSTAVKRFKVQ